MKIAVLGGGFTGLTASYVLSKKGHSVTLFEREKTLGGLASGFIKERWNWHLERTVHHLFSNDQYILDLAREIGFKGIFFESPETASLYDFGVDRYHTIPLDTPGDLLRFPLLSLPHRIRVGMVLAFLKLSPFFSVYERVTAERFLQKTMGEQAWIILWRELFRKKFGKYAGNVLASFIWARIKKRTKRLGYPMGGFQAFVDSLEEKLEDLGVKRLKDQNVEDMQKRGENFLVNGGWFDAVVSTLPTPVVIRLARKILPYNYITRLKRIKYLHAVSLILESESPLLKKTYWLNVATPEFPVMGIFQQTNFVDKKHYGGNNVVYLGWYVEKEDKIWKMEKQELLDFIYPYLKILNTKYSILNTYLFKAPFAQPIFDKSFVHSVPAFETPTKRFYMANLDMTYPYDRGTNYAVGLGKKVAEYF